jgi:subtilisin family serine protease
MVVLFWNISLSISVAQEKQIRLRQQLIRTQPATPAARIAPQTEDPVSGLYLLQLEGRLDQGSRDILVGMGIELLTYVPDDAFIVRLREASPAAIRALPAVRWLGEYRLDYKLHSALARWRKEGAAGLDRRVNILLSPRTDVLERGLLQRRLSRLEHSSETRFGGLMRGRIQAGQLLELLSSPWVLWVEPAPTPKLVDEIAAKIVAGDGGSGRLYTQELGFDGSGVTVAVADSGLDTGIIEEMHPDIAGRVTALFYYGALTDASDGHSHGTHVTGIVAGNASTGEQDENGFLYGLGVAPGSKIVAQRLFDDLGGYEAPPSYETLTRDAVRAGADIGSNSWGDDTQGAYDISAAEFDALVRDADALTPGDQEYILEFSAGNAGPGARTIGSPAVGKNVIATGASQNDRLDLFIYGDGIDAMADFSSRGPCEDGRIKPDVVAPGTWIASMKSRVAPEDNAWASISDDYIYQGGTSQAGPQVSGAAAVYVQYHKSLYGKKPSPAMVKAVLINSAIDMDDDFGTSSIPNQDEGWGRVDLTRVIGAEPRRYDLTDQTVRLSSGQVFERRVIVASQDREELKVTLAYTDVPGFPGAIPALVNDLDLEVVGPDGTVYRGNQFAGGESVANPLRSDRLNNVEGVHLRLPQEGEYLIRIRAFNVVQDAIASTPLIDQDFALVVSGGLPVPSTAAILMDRPSYTSPSFIKLAVLDPELASQQTLTVAVKSTTESVPESVLLRLSGSSLLFTGSIATVIGPAVQDGRLQIAHNDVIEIMHRAGDGQELKRIARGDLVAPIIGSVATTNEFGNTVVSWLTDEPSSSIVRYGLSGLSAAVTNEVAVTNHSVTLAGLVPRRSYVFEVVARDEAGNHSTNNNGGALFTFTSAPNKTLLLVDAYEPDQLFDTDFIPLTSYTSVLDALGVSYDVWDRSARPEIKLENLETYRVVIWRINDMDFFAGISPGEVAALDQFQETGGSFFMASMEGLSRFSNPTFQTQIAHVASFEADLEAPGALGSSGDPVSDGLELSLDYSNYAAFAELTEMADLSDHLTAGDEAAPILTDAVSGEPIGLRFPRFPAGVRRGRSMYLAFPLDAIRMNGPSPNNRTEFMRRALAFLAPGADGTPTITLDNGRYTLSSRMSIELGNSELAERGSIEVRAWSDTTPEGVRVTLTESPKLGVFRGSLILVNPTVGQGVGRLVAAEGDDIWVRFVGPTPGQTITASARIDTIAPNITDGPDIEADYEGATVSWTTSEAADSLIEFGETRRLGRTAFRGSLDVEHELTFQGLDPDRLYYYKITSRDQAGNAVEDDNGGQLYTFRTLAPRGLPWRDNLDSGGEDWTVVDSEFTIGTWQLGVPRNGMETAAHSPPNAWASNLNGGVQDLAESFLVSPAVNLAGGNRAVLKFWHSYDFLQKSELDIIIGGEVLLITNNALTPIVLLSLGDERSNWLEEEIDLTPYLGRVASVVFHFVTFSLENERRAGWLIDDVSIVVDTVPTASVEVTNNLAQSRFVISGPASRTGAGTHFLDNNLPAGEYRIVFNPVPFYHTPPPQTNTVALGEKLVFSGLYAFEDANANRISDDWEKAYFGQVAASHPGDRDSDQDGQTDLGEFLAGTNPNSHESVLRIAAPLLQPGGAVVLNWSTSAGRIYRVVQSSDFLAWEPVTGWISARSASLSQVLPPEDQGRERFFRVEVLP